MQIRLFRGLGEPVWVNALSSACERLGPDPRRALGPAATPAASTGRTRDRTRPMLQNVRKFLPGRRPHVTQCMVRPCVARGFRRAGVSGLASMYAVSDWSWSAPDHHGYQRACVLISGQASTGHLGHQCSHAPGRPILHLFSSSRRPRQVKRINLATSSRTPHFSASVAVGVE